MVLDPGMLQQPPEAYFLQKQGAYVELQSSRCVWCHEEAHLQQSTRFTQPIMFDADQENVQTSYFLYIKYQDFVFIKEI